MCFPPLGRTSVDTSLGIGYWIDTPLGIGYWIVMLAILTVLLYFSGVIPLNPPLSNERLGIRCERGYGGFSVKLIRCEHLEPKFALRAPFRPFSGLLAPLGRNPIPGTEEAPEGPEDPAPVPREGPKGRPHGTPLFFFCQTPF